MTFSGQKISGWIMFIVFASCGGSGESVLWRRLADPQLLDNVILSKISFLIRCCLLA